MTREPKTEDGFKLLSFEALFRPSKCSRQFIRQPGEKRGWFKVIKVFWI